MIMQGLDCLTPLYINFEGGQKSEFLRVPCGKCINCKARRSNEWCLRLAMESQYYGDGLIAFVTLTYAPEYVPCDFLVDGELLTERDRKVYNSITDENERQLFEVTTLHTKDVQLFIKRLRKHLGYPIRYYAVGEYGGQKERPHIHLMIFGLKPQDHNCIGYNLSEWVCKSKGRYIDSRYIAWSYGHVDIKPFHSNTCRYIAGYIQKKLYGDSSNPYRVAEFLRCSQHIGERWFYDNLSLFDDKHPYIDFQGVKYPIPRRFREKLVKLGKLSKMDLSTYYELQILEYKQFIKDKLIPQGVDISDYNRQRRINAVEKQKRFLNGRNSRF